MTITTKDFIDWKSNPVTKAVFTHLKERITDVGTELTFEAGQDPARDRFKVGYIQAIRDTLEVSAEDAKGFDND